MIRGDERYWANMVLDVIEHVECPMLMYEGEKMIVRKALKAYLEDHKTEPTISKMEQVDKDINVRSKDEPRKEQNFCGKCRYLYRDFKYGLSCYRLMDNEPCKYEERKDEPQTCSVNGRPYSECSDCEYFRCTADESQTDINWKDQMWAEAVEQSGKE